MKTKKVTLLLIVTVISLLTIFLVLLLDDNALAAGEPEGSFFPNLDLSQMTFESMVEGERCSLPAEFLRIELELMKVV